MKPRLDIGTYGAILFRAMPSGHVEARCRYRDWDGVARIVQATARTERQAEKALKAKLTERQFFQTGEGQLSADSTHADLAAYWLTDLDNEGRISPSTRQNYEWHLAKLVLPVFGNLALWEIGVARCDAFIKGLGRQSYSKARQAKNVLRQSLALAVRHEILPRSPMDGIARLHKPPHQPNALTPREVNAIRTAVAFWEIGLSPSGPKPDGQLSAIIEVMLGTSARIGEGLALRLKDLDLDATAPSVRICGTIVYLRGKPPYRQDHPKTSRSLRTVAIPTYTADAIRKRLRTLRDASPDALLFSSRNDTPLTTNNVRRQLRHVLELAGIDGVTPHSFRRTVATVINEHANADLAAELLGHTDPKITVQHYIRRREMVNPITASILQQTFTPEL
jgi:integrase